MRRKRLKVGDKVLIKRGSPFMTNKAYLTRYDGRWWWVDSRPNSRWGYPFKRHEIELIEPFLDKEYLEMFV